MIHNMWQYISLNNKYLTNTFVNKEISQKYGTFSALGRSQINILILNKAQKMAWVVPLINMYNMSTNNWTSNNHLTNTDCEWKSVTHGRTDRRTKTPFVELRERWFSELKKYLASVPNWRVCKCKIYIYIVMKSKRN